MYRLNLGLVFLDIGYKSIQNPLEKFKNWEHGVIPWLGANSDIVRLNASVLTSTP